MRADKILLQGLDCYLVIAEPENFCNMRYDS